MRSARRSKPSAPRSRQVSKAFDEIMIPHAFEQAEFADAVLRSHRGLMSAADYKKILTCLHPDTAMPGWKDRCAEAFDLFKKLEGVLVLPEQNRIPTSDLPRTVEELLARRKHGRRTGNGNAVA